MAVHTVWCAVGRTHLTWGGKSWDLSYVPEHFARTLRQRRERQADAVLDEIRTLGDAEPILDYGTGQAVLLARAIEMGLDCLGCDLDVDVPFSKAPPGTVLRLDHPWAMPNGRWGTVAMLDVIEHHHDPASFLSQVNARYLILKVPTATGPPQWVRVLFRDVATLSSSSSSSSWARTSHIVGLPP